MFIISTAKVRQINDTTKLFQLKDVNRIDLFFQDIFQTELKRVGLLDPENNLNEIKSC